MDSNMICKGCYWNHKIADGCEAFTERYTENCPGFATEEQGREIEAQVQRYAEKKQEVAE